MDDPRLPSGPHSGTDPEDWIHVSYSRILKCCRGAGLASSEADDIAQDIWLWLLREGGPGGKVSMPWLSAVSRNFILRYRRRKFRRTTREGCSLEGGPLDAGPETQTQEGWLEFEVEDLLDRVAASLPEIERKMLALIRKGHSLAESARLLGIPRGSQGYHLRRLVACARRELTRKGEIPGCSTTCPGAVPPARHKGH